jgi:hypothetical protein
MAWCLYWGITSTRQRQKAAARRWAVLEGVGVHLLFEQGGGPAVDLVNNGVAAILGGEEAEALQATDGFGEALDGI